MKDLNVPIEVIADSRLTLETMRVLLALFSFRDENTGVSVVGREAISRLCGLHPSNISAATSKLVELGWILKQGNGGGSQCSKYTITIPPVVSEIAEAHKARSLKWKKEITRSPISYAVRMYVFERDAYRCVKCQSFKKLCVDHKFPHSLGGSNDTDNLQTLCWACNSEKSNKVGVME